MASTDTTPRLLWKPTNANQTRLWEFITEVNSKHKFNIQSYEELHRYSISKSAQFWADCFDFLNLISTGSYVRSVDPDAQIDAMPRWFEGISLNFAQNILYTQVPGCDGGGQNTKFKEDTKIAVTEVREGLESTRHIDWATLRRDSGRLAGALKTGGVANGDRVFAIASNSYVTLTLFLATTWLGGIFSSVAPDMGITGILERARQITPKFIFVDENARYNAKTLDLSSKIQEIVKATRDSPGLQSVILLPRLTGNQPQGSLPGTQTLAELLSSSTDTQPPFEQLPFHAPALICYSSGTTGQPKCIVHSIGAITLNGAKEGVLHAGNGPNSVSFQYTTTGWIMYLACVSALQSGSRTILYDGSPFVPEITTLLKLVAREGVTIFGTSPKWLGALASHRVAPRKILDLSALEVVTSTGMVLPDSLFEWFYSPDGFPPAVRLCNMSGGTDIAGCFIVGNPISPLYVGGCQAPALGMAVEVFDASESHRDGKPVSPGNQGEMVATKPFPNVPVFFWNDTAPPSSPRSKLHASYFARFDHVWTQGDLVSINPLTKAIMHHGRADGVLNPSGIRYGSAEIYSVIEKRFADVILDSLCVGQRRPSDSDESVLLFLQMKPGKTCDGTLVNAVKSAIRRDLSARHVPKYIFQTPEIPITATFKKLEVPVKAIVSGKKVAPSSAVMNPQSLDFFYQFADIEKVVRGSKL